jgi:hypothetical protein
MPVWPSSTPSCPSGAQTPSSLEKLAYYFSLILFPAKINRNETLLKNNVRFCSFIQVLDDSGAKYEAKYLEK